MFIATESVGQDSSVCVESGQLVDESEEGLESGDC